MRCYFMRGGHITGVENLTQEADKDLILEAAGLFEDKGKPRGDEGFEVWVGPRFVYCFPPKVAPA